MALNAESRIAPDSRTTADEKTDAEPVGDTDRFAIRTHNLRKAYGDKVAVRNLSLSVPHGSIFGFLGPNGAGKSTSIKMLLGLVRPTGGEATLLGHAAGSVAVRRRIGFLPEHFRFYDWLTPAELLRLHGRLCKVPEAELKTRIPSLLDLVGLTPHRDKRVHDFSKGMMQRIGLAQALIGEPDIVFLDEPTSGLDPMGRRLVRDVIRAQRERGATVFLNSHLLSEVEITCDNVAFLKDGEIVASRDLRAVPQEEVSVDIRIRNCSQDALRELERCGMPASLDGERLSVTVESANRLPDLLRRLVQSGADVYSFTPGRASLEDLFVRIMGQDRGL